VKIFDIDMRAIELSVPTEGMATAITLFENMETETELDRFDRLGIDYTYLAMGMVSSTAVYKYSYRFKCLTFLLTITEPISNVGGNISVIRHEDN